MDLSTRLQAIAAVVALAGLGARLLTVWLSKPNVPARFDPNDVGLSHPGKMLVEFTSPYCHECQIALPVLKQAADTFGAPLAVIDAKQRPDLMAKYSIKSTPVILVVDERGAVRRSWLNSPTSMELHQALA